MAFAAPLEGLISNSFFSSAIPVPGWRPGRTVVIVDVGGRRVAVREIRESLSCRGISVHGQKGGPACGGEQI